MAGLRLSNGEQLACTQRSWHQLSTNSYGRYGNKTQKTLRSATEVKLFGFAQEALLFPFFKCMLKKKKRLALDHSCEQKKKDLSLQL